MISCNNPTTPVTLGLVPRVQRSVASVVVAFNTHFNGPLDHRHKAEDDGLGI